MENILTVAVIFIIVVISCAIFIIYFIFKILQFVVLAVNLYKKMVNRQDATLKLLLDIRDNTKNYENINSSKEEITNSSSNNDDDTFICENCKTEVPEYCKICPHCGAQFE